MKNKKTIMTLAAFLILFFHLWVPLFPFNEISLYLRRIAYIGVDIFFFLSAYSIGSRKVEDYRGFLIKRFRDVYLVFVFFAILALCLGNLSFVRFLKVISGYELLKKGGGSFLWFVPVIMLVYVLLPLYHKLYSKNRLLVMGISLMVWFAVGFAVTRLTNYSAMFIWWNRIPIILTGFAVAEYLSRNPAYKLPYKPVIIATLLIIGGFLLWRFGAVKKLSLPLTDFFYVMAIPLCLGLILLVGLIKDNKVTRAIGSATLEMYGLQMVLGYKVANYLVKNISNRLICNLLTFSFVIGLAIILSQLKCRILSGSREAGRNKNYPHNL